MQINKLEDSFQGAELDGELVMIHADSGKFFALKDVALDIWQRLDSQPDFDLLCADLCSEYEGEDAEIRSNARQFIDSLVSNGFAEYC